MFYRICSTELGIFITDFFVNGKRQVFINYFPQAEVQVSLPSGELCLKIVIDTFFNASNVQLWYDQYLPASVTEVHKDMMGELFGLTKTPEEVGQAQDEAMAKAREE